VVTHFVPQVFLLRRADEAAPVRRYRRKLYLVLAYQSQLDIQWCVTADAGPDGHVKVSLGPSWNPAVVAGASYNIRKNWYATGSVTYLSLKTNAMASSVAANGQTVLSTKTRVTADPVIVFLGTGYRF
jgi:outer membrane protein W